MIYPPYKMNKQYQTLIQTTNYFWLNSPPILPSLCEKIDCAGILKKIYGD
jgi:hypothetical protein